MDRWMSRACVCSTSFKFSSGMIARSRRFQQLCRMKSKAKLVLLLIMLVKKCGLHKSVAWQVDCCWIWASRRTSSITCIAEASGRLAFDPKPRVLAFASFHLCPIFLFHTDKLVGVIKRLSSSEVSSLSGLVPVWMCQHC